MVKKWQPVIPNPAADRRDARTNLVLVRCRGSIEVAASRGVSRQGSGRGASGVH
jgi:hypothetical protein